MGYATDVRPGVALLREAMLYCHVGRIAVVSSFGADSAVLLALVADIDPSLPVLFLDTGKHFAETLAYRDRLAARLGLTDIRGIMPDQAALDAHDPAGGLHAYDPDACCEVRKTLPLTAALAPFDAWITGRKRHQTADRAGLSFSQFTDGKVKFNPLADWTSADIAAEFRRRSLPAHPLVAQGYASIGCLPCTLPVRAGEDARAGRWSDFGKTECGIHRPAAGQPA